MSASKELFRFIGDGASLSKKELIAIINEQTREVSSVMGLLDAYKITRDNISTNPGQHVLTLYGRVYAAMNLLHKCGHVPAYDGEKDSTDAYGNRL